MQGILLCFLILTLGNCILSNHDPVEGKNSWGAVSTYSLCSAGWPSPDCEEILQQQGHTASASPEDSCKDDPVNRVVGTRQISKPRSNIVDLRLESPSNASIRFGAFSVRYSYSVSGGSTIWGSRVQTELLIDDIIIDKQLSIPDSDQEWSGIFFPPALPAGWHRLQVKITANGDIQPVEVTAAVLIKTPPR
jgi:hypothetical protein